VTVILERTPPVTTISHSSGNVTELDRNGHYMFGVSPILLGHICAGTLGLLSGTAAISFRKGSRRHALAGKIFVASMLTMAVAAV